MISRLLITTLFTALAVSVAGCGPKDVLHLRTSADDYRSLGIDKSKVQTWGMDGALLKTPAILSGGISMPSWTTVRLLL